MSKNFLIGYGETLTHSIKIPGAGGPKSHPYSIEESKRRVSRQLKKLLLDSRSIPDIACPHGEIVAKFTLHPAYISKSYYPEAIFEIFDLKDVGSKAVTIAPEKWATSRHPEQEVTSCIYAAGTRTSFERLDNQLQSQVLRKAVLNEVRKLELVSLLTAEEKIKSLLPLPDGSLRLEVALHAGEDDSYIMQSFANLVEHLSGTIESNKIRRVGGITFLPVVIANGKQKELAQFSYLRVLRSVPKLRYNKPNIIRTQLSHQISIPTEDALDPTIKVAIFDGGLGANHLITRWATETILSPSNTQHPDYLLHGGEVTSTYLFGNIEDSQTQLPKPFTNVDHYRVLCPQNDGDPDLFDVLSSIESAILGNDYKFINLSLGPQIPIDDDDIHVWTATLDKHLQSGNILATVAVGNDGDLDESLNRIQPPSDMVNCLAVGSANSPEENWGRASYSCIGPGRSPGVIKPDGLSFGGETNNLIKLYSPITNSLVATAGTSFAAPLALRIAAGIDAVTDYNLSAIAIKALMIHLADPLSHSQKEVGWGRFPQSVDHAVYCDDDEATVIYQGLLTHSEHMRALIPFPDFLPTGDIQLKATFCFAATTDPEHSVHYTKNGLEIVFRPNLFNVQGKNSIPKSGTFFSTSKLYRTEQKLRSDAHKWETCLSKKATFRPDTLRDPCFDIYYHSRDKGKQTKTAPPQLPYALIVTIKSPGNRTIYNSIIQRYQTLSPIQLKSRVQIRPN